MKMNNLSPVTNLASNLKNLSTLEDTPVRLENWSSASFSESSFRPLVSDLPPASPLTAEITYGENHKTGVLKDSLLTPSKYCTEQNKENDHPNATAKKCNFLKQDSINCGYYRPNLNQCDLLLSTEQFKEEDVLQSLLQTDAEGKEDFVNMPDMTSLLSKPLIVEKNPTRLSRKRLSIRRCLSMEMEHHKPESSLPLNDSCAGNSMEKPQFKQTDTVGLNPSANKRRRSPLQEIPENSLKRTFSETVMRAVQEAHLDPDLIGDCSKRFVLPLTDGRHQDLKCISAQTLVHVIQGRFNRQVDNFTIVDCRYPYEFDAGHIQGAINIFSKERIEEVFLSEQPDPGRNIVIFHCEFSSERAPNLCRYLRNRDRKLNEKNYPKLFHPEMYLLDGGYKSFFENFKRYCEPQCYKPMNHKDHGSELRYFRAKSKSWGADSKPRSRLKSVSLSKTL